MVRANLCFQLVGFIWNDPAHVDQNPGVHGKEMQRMGQRATETQTAFLRLFLRY